MFTPLKLLFRSRDKPKNRVGGTLTFLFGKTSSGKIVNEQTAMQSAAVYACVRILSEAIASLPIHVYRFRLTEERAYTPASAILPLHNEPNPEMTSFVFRDTDESSFAWQRLRTNRPKRTRSANCTVPPAPEQDGGKPHKNW